MKVLMEHHTKSLGLDILKCPLCRKDFGSIDELKKVFCDHPITTHKNTQKRHHTHYGTQCASCQATPIRHILHCCTVCSDIQLCDECFKRGEHSEHTFTFQTIRKGLKQPSERVVPTLLPPNLVTALQSRDLTNDDYEILLNLDKPQPQGTLPLHIINSFPLIKICGPGDRKHVGLDGDGGCGICMAKVGYGEIIRQIPCGHGFHQPCIDRWLLHQRTVCPKCGLAAYSNLGSDSSAQDGAYVIPDAEASVYQVKSYGIVDTSRAHERKGVRKPKKEPTKELEGTDGNLGIFLTGSCILSNGTSLSNDNSTAQPPVNFKRNVSIVNSRKATKQHIPSFSVVRGYQISAPDIQTTTPLTAAAAESHPNTFCSNVHQQSKPKVFKKQSTTLGRKSFGLPPIPKTSDSRFNQPTDRSEELKELALSIKQFSLLK